MRILILSLVLFMSGFLHAKGEGRHRFYCVLNYNRIELYVTTSNYIIVNGLNIRLHYGIINDLIDKKYDAISNQSFFATSPQSTTVQFTPNGRTRYGDTLLDMNIRTATEEINLRSCFPAK